MKNYLILFLLIANISFSFANIANVESSITESIHEVKDSFDSAVWNPESSNIVSESRASDELLDFGLDKRVIGYRRVDPCTMTTHNFSIIKDTVLVPGYPNSAGIDIYVEKSVKEGLPGVAPVVMIINGNSYRKEEYEEMAEFLAKNGFIVAVAEREGTSPDSLFPLASLLYSVFPFHQIDYSSPIALIGHSKGGFVVNESAIQNFELGVGFNIKSLINVAPNILDGNTNVLSGRITGEHTPSFLSLWGSRDRDMQGNVDLPREGIAAYDRVGTESTTTCGNPPCILLDAGVNIDKTSIYINGANHAEILKPRTTALANIPMYLSGLDQFCVGKAYINAFLRKNLNGEKTFNRFLRNETLPPSLQAITTFASDGLGEPTGSPLRLYHQFSPRFKRSIENFEDNHYSLNGKSPYVVDFITPENTNTGSPFYIRHQTNSLFVAWEERNANQYIGFKVPVNYEDSSSFTHLSIRIGLVNGITFPMYANNNDDKQIRIGLRDQSYLSQSHTVKLQRPDKHTTMQTITIPLEDFSGLNLSKLQMVYLSFNFATQGSIIVDNIEFIRDTN